MLTRAVSVAMTAAASDALQLAYDRAKQAPSAVRDG
jgi:hypothetical protein